MFSVTQLAPVANFSKKKSSLCANLNLSKIKNKDTCEVVSLEKYFKTYTYLFIKVLLWYVIIGYFISRLFHILE